MHILVGILSLVFLILGIAIFIRVPRAEPADRVRYMRAGVGAIAAAAGSASLLKSPGLALLFYLMAAILVLSRGPVHPRPM